MLTLGRRAPPPRRCHGDCHTTLTVEQRTRAVEASYVLDDASPGLGIHALYEIHGDVLWQEAQQRGDPGLPGRRRSLRRVRLSPARGAMIHEAIHASFGDTTKANYGVPFGLPYGCPRRSRSGRGGVPRAVQLRRGARVRRRGDPRTGALRPRLACPQRASVGHVRLHGAMRWSGPPRLSSRRAHRRGASPRPLHHACSTLEEEARAWLTGERVEGVVGRIEEAAVRGRTTRPRPYPSAEQLAALPPQRWAATTLAVRER